MRVLVTGSKGFLGQHLVRRLMREDWPTALYCGVNPKTTKAEGWEIGGERLVRDVYLDVANEGQAEWLLNLLKPQVVFHLAANPLTREWGPELTRVNVLGTHNLLAHCPEGCRFVLASSATVYGDARPDKGFHHSENSPCRPQSAYAASKVAAESLVEAFHAQGKVRGVVLRLVALVGAGATHGLLPDVVRKVGELNGVLPLLGDAPGSEKPFLHIGDAAEAFVLAGANSSLAGPYNVSPDDELSVEEVAKIALDVMGVKKDLAWLGAGANWKGDNRYVRVSNWRITNAGWKPTHTTSAAAVRQATKELAGVA